jgi:hypothetical protein
MAQRFSQSETQSSHRRVFGVRFRLTQNSEEEKKIDLRSADKQ